MKKSKVYEYLKANPPSAAMIRKALESAFHVDTDKWELILVPVNELDPDAEEHIDERRYNSYVLAMMEDPAAFPPILVSPRKGYYRIVDGHHRYRAAQEAGVDWLWALSANWRYL